jgi:S-adenosylmethionine/arginine decarboxylase-like enzyme
MQGLHLTADLHACRAPEALMTDSGTLRALCLRVVADAGLTPVGELFHRFAPPAGATPHGAGAPGPAGVTGVVLLAESHLTVHTWPELGGVTVDAYVCNFSGDNSLRAQRLIDALVAAFEPGRVHRQSLQRAAIA